ncbi:hypothetical protein CTAYLR_002849 [Chrysophaeum taylorii]|uniref:CRAL-TRIO domain-containing protein n=1 Tax=Chrysophaeum taylorii TaxID=2483200 RepID=A0AAD7U9Q4_9STRA|nr:hypothetical protein CTAYLR_002849 [Chrysophaeum taylorii]
MDWARRAEEDGAPGGGVLFCGTLEKRHPYYGTTYPRFVVLTPSSLHWFRRLQSTELFGEPRGVIQLIWLRRTYLAGTERRELVLEFDSPSPLGAIYNTQDYHRSSSSSSSQQLPRIASAESLRGPGPKYERFLGSRRSFLAPSAAAALAWRAAIELAARDAEATPKTTTTTTTTTTEAAGGRFSGISLATATPSSLADYLRDDVADDMEDGYGDANFLEALGTLVERDDAYALPPVCKSPHASPVVETRRRLRERSEMKFAAVATWGGRVVARDVVYKVASSTNVVISKNIELEIEENDDEGLAVTLGDGATALVPRSTLLLSNEDDVIIADLMDPRVDAARRVLSIKVSSFGAVDETSLVHRVVVVFVIVVLLLVWRRLRRLRSSFSVAAEILLLLLLLASSWLLLRSRRRRRRQTIRVEILGDAAKPPPSEESPSLRKPIHPKFLAAARGDRAEATRRWEQSLAYRRRFRFDDALRERQTHFDVIKDAYPHWLGGRTRANELVYWERLGHVNVDKLKQAGVTLDVLVRHYVFSNEWTWKVLSPDPDGPRSFQVVVLDVSAVRLSQVGGLRLDYLRTCADIAQINYPERTSKYVIVNAPVWISAAWRVVEPILSADTRKKIVICRAGKPTKDKLLELIEPHHVPECYGGTFARGQSVDVARRTTPEELAFKAYVDDLDASASPRKLSPS